jgi:Lar family restriction alleviation protein
MKDPARCPYCGEEPTIEKFSLGIEKFKDFIEVYCWKHKRLGRVKVFVDETGVDAAISNAIDNWNENIARYTAKSKSKRENLARCPCCGGKADVRQEQKTMGDADGNFSEFTIWKVECLACGLSTYWAFDQESVAKRWNMRAET